MADYPKLPYGISDFIMLRREEMTYVDKTRYIETLEQIGNYLFFLRPRRFGKSLLMNQMAIYYDVAWADECQEIFSGTYIGKTPTPEANSSLVLVFNFAEINPDPTKVEASFEEYVKMILADFLRRYENVIPSIDALQQQMDEAETSAGKLGRIFKHLATEKQKLCLLIDEYDNFTNTILSMKDIGKATYERITHGTGFYRNFFNVLKGGTGQVNAAVSRLVVTGVSPVTMDDLTSGFNIGQQVSLSPALAGIAGFTRADVMKLMEQYEAAKILDMSLDALMELLEYWYGGYRFHRKQKESLFNPDMILYFLKAVTLESDMPRNMTDMNVRIDYGKLHHLVAVDRHLNGNFSRIQQVLSEGYLLADISEGFPLEELVQEENFISLLYYFGLISHRGFRESVPCLEIPNQTIALLMYGFLRSAMERTGVFSLSFMEMQALTRKMAHRGEWEEYFRYIGEQIKAQTSVRDFVEGEKVIQSFLLAWLSLTEFFTVHSEYEANKGFCDLYLEPFVAKYPDIQYGYLVEIKYLKRGEVSESKLAQKVAELVEEARAQLAQYRQEPRLDKVGGNITWVCPILVFHGWELVAVET